VTAFAMPVPAASAAPNGIGDERVNCHRDADEEAANDQHPAPDQSYPRSIVERSLAKWTWDNGVSSAR